MTLPLSKSEYMQARSCGAKLYYRRQGYPDNKSSNAYLRLLAHGGYMVDALARAKYPEGIAAPSGHDPIADAAHGRELLRAEHVTVFDATILHGGRIARADVLVKNGEAIDLIEVKSKGIDGAAHAQSLAKGGRGLLQNATKPGVAAKWREQLEDITYQTLVRERMLPGIVVRPFLMLVDASKRAKVDNVPSLFRVLTGGPNGERTYGARFIGEPELLDSLDLLTILDVSAEVALLRDEVDAAASAFESMLDEPFEADWRTIGADCRNCEFSAPSAAGESGFHHCWGDLADKNPHVLELTHAGQVKTLDGEPLVETLFAEGKASLFDVSIACLAKADMTWGPLGIRQRRQIEHTRSGTEWIGPTLRANIGRVEYPLYFIDFECSRLAMPYHVGMRPWGQVSFQWSCHTVAEPGAQPVHTEWLNADDVWPNRAFTVALRDAVGETGSVLIWSQYEISTLRETAEELPRFAALDPELHAWLKRLELRAVDMHKWAQNDYYHPGMKGRTSIKVVLDALWRSDAAMREQFKLWGGRDVPADADPYRALPAIEINGVMQDVHEGTGAMTAYQAMMYGVERDDPDGRNAWAHLLRQYCELDTLSMVLVFEYWRRATSAGN